MKTFARGFAPVLMAGAVLLSPLHSDAQPLGSMRLRLVQGDVQVKIVETGDWAPASVNMPLAEGDELWVPEGSLSAIQTNNGAYVRLDGSTALQVLRMERDSFQFYLSQGRTYVLNNAPTRSVLQFDTPDASIRTFGNATFRIDIPDGETDVLVFRGTVTAENAGGTTRVGSRSMLVLGSDGYAELSPLPRPDNWQRWNERRDRVVLARGRSHGYLPDELRVYSSDFEENGRWVNVPEYGYVWTPTVLVIGDWAPYRHGRWVWRGGDYVWIGYEPWGWAPYHYGRWSFIVNIGWFWVPPRRGEVFWAPGYVGWVRTADHVAWVPLAPREIYYGRGNYGRYSVNVTNVNITQVRVTNVYRNINVTNSITVVNQTTFVTGRPAPVERNVVVNVREDFAKHRNVVVGSPPIKPVETSYHPVVRSIPEAKRPPERIRKIDTKELKQSRPLVTEPERSAIRPQAEPRPLEIRKVDEPRSVDERAKERRPVPRGEQRGPDAPPGKVERGVKPVPRVEQKEAPAEEVEPGAPQGGPPGKVERGVKPVPRVKLKEAPAEKVEPGAPQGGPPGKVERGVKPVPRVKQKEAPAEKVEPEAPQGEPDRDTERDGDRGGRRQTKPDNDNTAERGKRER